MIKLIVTKIQEIKVTKIKRADQRSRKALTCLAYAKQVIFFLGGNNEV